MKNSESNARILVATKACLLSIYIMKYQRHPLGFRDLLDWNAAYPIEVTLVFARGDHQRLHPNE